MNRLPITRQGGLSMIEVLVAVAILSIGLLGTAALQVQSKRANLGSVERTLASMLIHDMFERMRANPDAYDTYLTQLDASNDIGTGALSSPSPTCTSGSRCDDPAELAEYDAWQWEQLLMGATETSNSVNTGGLVLPVACMTGPAGGGEGLYTITINWRGHAEFTDTLDDPCGANGTGRYNGDAGTGTLRRMVSVSSYLDE